MVRFLLDRLPTNSNILTVIRNDVSFDYIACHIERDYSQTIIVNLFPMFGYVINATESIWT